MNTRLADHPVALDILRHDAAHILAQAVTELFPGTRTAIGPAIEHGFYYDFHRDTPFTVDDLPRIEARMREIVARALPIERLEWTRTQTRAHFAERGESYKLELLDAIPEGETVSVYRQGEFVDLCRGPHQDSTARLGDAFRLTKVAGAYWRGDHRNPMLQRIYGTAWATREQLEDHLFRLEEAERRDHRRLGKDMDLFHFQDEAPGAVFWHPNGLKLFRQLQDYMRTRQDRAGYEEIRTPGLMDRALWEATGHWEKFGDAMFTTEPKDERVLALKPMNCPGGILVYNQQPRSYRDLPLRLAEFGEVHRFEPSGSLHGLMRVRAFTQDDAHIFCTEDQITRESLDVCDLILSIYRDFGFDDIRIKFSDRPAKRVGSDQTWDKAEAALLAAVQATGLSFSHNPGEGAFYGPKLEFVLRDAIGRDWQCGTLQVDLNLPERLDCLYTGEDGQKHRPVMLHRALFGSLERFTGILLEHHAGRLPLWLAPVQAVVATITAEADDYAREVVGLLRRQGMRMEADLRNEKIGYKIREHSQAKVPLLLVVGKREAEQRSVSVRRLGGDNSETSPLEALLSTLPGQARPPC